jgi:hypothetical protein
VTPVIVESPFAPRLPDGLHVDEADLSTVTAALLDRNQRYARAAMRDCLLRGEAPLASHVLYTLPGVLDDTLDAERALGIEAGLVWGQFAKKTIVYTDLGISPGMQLGIDRAARERREVVYRALQFRWGHGAGERQP